MGKQINKINGMLLGAGGLAGSVAGLVALLTTIFGWPVPETTAILSVGALAVFAIGFVIDKLFKRMDDKLEGMEGRMVERDRVQNLSLTRLELVDLIRHQPENKIAIEKKARYYFTELNGNDYLSATYSNWAKAHDGDISFVLGK